jgi:sialate O-acetylesterase
VTADVGEGDNVHPKNKQAVAERLSQLARRLAYGEGVDSDGPIYERSLAVGEEVRIWFEHSRGLFLKDDDSTPFEVAGQDGIFHPAIAEIDRGVLVIRSRDVPHPTKARYAWSDNPKCTLYNGLGLPASPFRTQ